MKGEKFKQESYATVTYTAGHVRFILPAADFYDF